MTNSNAERQRRFRYRALKDPDGTLRTRLQVMISVHANASLNRIVEKTGMKKQEVIEKAVLEMEKALQCID